MVGSGSAITGRLPRIHGGDVVAGVSVALVLIPQSLAYAKLAGLPPEIGLYAAAFTPLAAAAIASSPYLQTGPTALTSLLTLGALTTLAPTGSAEYVALAALLALVVGVMRVATGFVRAGPLAYLMSQPVVVGFSSAAAILIVSSQLPTALGLGSTAINPIFAAGEALARPDAWLPAAVVVALVSVIVVLGSRRVHRLIPGALIVVVGAIALSAAGAYPGPIVGAIPAGLPPFSLDLPYDRIPALLIPALVIAILGFAEPASIARRYATADRQPWSPNRELVSQGVANIVAGFSGGLPTGGSFSRTALNRLAGARTRWSSVVTSIVVLAFLPFTSVLSPLPTAVLAAIVVVSVVALVDVSSFRNYWRMARLQFGVALATFALTLATAPHLEQGLLAGIGLAIGLHLWREWHLAVPTMIDGDTLHLRPQGVLYFVSAPRLPDAMTRILAEHREVARLIVHLDGLGRVDLTGALILRDLLEDARQAGIEVEIADVPLHARRIVRQVFGELGPGLDDPAATARSDDAAPAARPASPRL